jgi:hypothetical protein
MLLLSKLKIVMAATLLTMLGGGSSEFKDDVSRLPSGVAHAYAVIKPRAEELKFREIPWLIDLNKGIELARVEGRPLLIWTGQQSHPLERC